jgi:hypothetical protein
MPGAMRLVKHLQRAGVPMAIATSTPRRTYERKMSGASGASVSQNFGACTCGDEVRLADFCRRTLGMTLLSQLFLRSDGPYCTRAACCGGDWSRHHSRLCLQVEKGKPAPDCFTATAAQLGVDPAECLVIEDAPSGVEVGFKKQAVGRGAFTGQLRLGTI